MIKKFLIGVLILISAYAAILIFFGSGDEHQNSTQPIIASKEKPNSPLRNLPTQPITQTTQTTAESNKNKESSPDISKEIVAQNLENAINQYLENGMKDFDASELKPSIAIKNLKITSDSSKKIIQVYLDDINSIYNRNFNQLSLLENPSLEASINMAPLISAYKKTIEQLYNVTVPQNLAPLHQEQLALLSAQKNALEIAKNYEADPLKTLLALQAGEEFGQEFQNLQTVLKQTIE